MSLAAHHALLYLPGVGSYLEHFQIMIGFKNQSVAAANPLLDQLRDVPQVGDEADLNAFRFQGKRHGVCRIVRNGKWRNFNITHHKLFARSKELTVPDFKFCRQRRPRGRGHVERAFQFERHPGKAGDMVGMFMGDDDGRAGFRPLANGGQPGEDLAPA